MELVRDVLDGIILDREGTEMGRVDGLVLRLEDEGPPLVDHLELGFTFVGSVALVLGFGVSAEAAIVVNLLATFYGLFQHANIRTPHG